MTTVTKSVIVPRSPRRMFELVDEVESYPEFLPWCAATQLFERSAGITRARIDIDYHGLKSHVTTVNRKQPYERMDLEFVDGPFRTFRGHWRFAALGEEGARVEFAFASASMDAVLAPVFGHIMETLVDRFVARADAVAAK